MNSIYERLLAGESVESIAEKFTDELNAAAARYEKEQAAIKQMQMEEEVRYEDAYALATQMLDFFVTHGGLTVDDDSIEEEIQDVADMLIQSLELTRKAKELADSVEAHPEAALNMLLKMMMC